MQTPTQNENENKLRSANRRRVQEEINETPTDKNLYEQARMIVSVNRIIKAYRRYKNSKPKNQKMNNQETKSVKSSNNFL